MLPISSAFDCFSEEIKIGQRTCETVGFRSKAQQKVFGICGEKNDANAEMPFVMHHSVYTFYILC